MKPKLHVILELAIEQGVKRGWHLAHKHVEHPEPHDVMGVIEDQVMSAITEYFTFEDNDFS
jgi:hypothetical protein